MENHSQTSHDFTSNQAPDGPFHLKSRRAFLKGASGTAAAIVAGSIASSSSASAYRRFGWGNRNRNQRLRHPSTAKLSRQLQRRRAAVYRVRVRNAAREYYRGTILSLPNSDERTLNDYIGNFSKTLPHNDLGEVDRTAYESLVAATRSGRSRDFDAIPLSSTSARKLANPQAAFSYSPIGGDSHSFSMPAAPDFSSAWNASEMAEVYLHALTRDIPFDSYATDPGIARAVTQLNEFSDFRGPKNGGLVTTGTLFRGETSADLKGNYISQFLLRPIAQSGALNEQLYQVPFQNDDHMITYEDWLNILRGGAPTTNTSFDPQRRYIATGRDLAEFVHTDYSYQAYLQAALILLGSGAPRNPGNPYSNSINQGGFVTHGGAEILTTIGNVALLGLKAAWYQKWNVHRRLRPEVFGGRIHNVKTNAASYPISSEILESSILDDVFAANGNYLLPMAYPEGSPTHPAYPAGHAVIAGACCTVLKAFFDDSTLLEENLQVRPGTDGTELEAYTGGDTLTVGGELNKLANNISLGRDIAGVHWRTDGTEGVLLGEKVAISYITELKRTYTDSPQTFIFEGFDGRTVRI